MVISVENRKIFPPVYFVSRWQGSPWNWVSALAVKKLEWWRYHKLKKVLSFCHLNTIPPCNRQSDSHLTMARVSRGKNSIFGAVLCCTF